jgi:hypothetical protein
LQVVFLLMILVGYLFGALVERTWGRADGELDDSI